MNLLCRENGIDFATESTKGTKDCWNGFFFAVFVFLVAKNSVREGGLVRHGRPGEGGYRSVTLGNGNVLADGRLIPPFAGKCPRSPGFAVNLTHSVRRTNPFAGKKIKVNQGGSSWLKVAQPILKHFYFMSCANRPRFSTGFLGQISTGNTGNMETFWRANEGKPETGNI